MTAKQRKKPGVRAQREQERMREITTNRMHLLTEGDLVEVVEDGPNDRTLLRMMKDVMVLGDDGVIAPQKRPRLITVSTASLDKNSQQTDRSWDEGEEQ